MQRLSSVWVWRSLQPMPTFAGAARPLVVRRPLMPSCCGPCIPAINTYCQFSALSEWGVQLQHGLLRREWVVTTEAPYCAHRCRRSYWLRGWPQRCCCDGWEALRRGGQVLCLACLLAPSSFIKLYPRDIICFHQDLLCSAEC